MRKREIFWIAVLVLVVGAWIYHRSHSQEKPVINVTPSLQLAAGRLGGGGGRRGGFGRGMGTNAAFGRGGFGRGGFGRGGFGRGGAGSGGVDNGTNCAVLFALGNNYQLTSLKVVEVPTNKVKGPEHILWHLVSTNGSTAVRAFYYGANIEGMTPYLTGVTPEPLLPHVAYRLDLEAGPIKGSTLFQTVELPTP
jgi:hypothetical protein